MLWPLSCSKILFNNNSIIKWAAMVACSRIPLSQRARAIGAGELLLVKLSEVRAANLGFLTGPRAHRPCVRATMHSNHPHTRIYVPLSLPNRTHWIKWHYVHIIFFIRSHVCIHRAQFTFERRYPTAQLPSAHRWVRFVSFCFLCVSFVRV